MFLDLWWDLDFFDCVITPLLSQYRTNRSTMLGTTPSFIMNFVIQIAFFAASDAEMYSASVVDQIALCKNMKGYIV